ncbi:MAG TPA: GNAT family protein [Acidimicrobiia bacterium]|nr:GNAT family protein [Acidimicrobiia bacterium]
MSRPLAVGRGVILARPRPDDEAEFLAAVQASRALHHPWVEPPDTATLFAAYLRRLRRSDQAGFFIREREGGGLAGVANLSNVVLGALCSAFLGYYALEPRTGHGHMTEGLGLVVDYAFAAMGLHRVEANVQPANTRSLAVVKHLGFRHEGFSPRYLMVAGEWRDHERWAVTVEDWRPAG